MNVLLRKMVEVLAMAALMMELIKHNLFRASYLQSHRHQSKLCRLQILELNFKLECRKKKKKTSLIERGTTN